MNKKLLFLLVLLIGINCYAADSYDTSTSKLTISQVKVSDTLYQNVVVTLGSVISVGTVLVADSFDTFDSAINQLTIPQVTVGSTTYYNVVISVGKVLSIGSSCVISTTCKKVSTPEVKGVMPGDGRISVMFNYIGGKITAMLSSSSNYSAASAYEAVCTSSDGLHAASSKLSSEFNLQHGNYTNPLVVSGLINGKTYSCSVTASAADVLPATSTVSDSVIPNYGPAYSSGVLGSTANSAHETAYPSYTSYCNYVNQSAISLQTPPTLNYYSSSGSWTSGTSQSTISCTSSTRTVNGNALPDYISSKFFTNGLTGYTSSPYNSGNPNYIGEKTVSKAVPLSGTISSLYSKGSSGFDTSACYNYTSTIEPSSSSNTKWTSGAAVWSSGAVRCYWVAYFSYLNNSTKVEPGTAEVYTGSSITYKVVGKNLYQDVGLDPSNAHNQPSGQPGTSSEKKYGYYHLHGMPEGQISRIGKGNSAMTLVGFAVDGFPIYARYGYKDPTNKSLGLTIMKSNYRIRTVAELKAAGYTDRPAASVAPYGTFEQDWVYDATSTLSNAGHLDACNGRYGYTPESPSTAVYHYFITDSYPFIPRCVFGAPASWANDSSVN
jgi:hypothetical protein